MASTNKTSLGLNMWEASDKPVRQDFINDNKIIDERIAKLNSDKAEASHTHDDRYYTKATQDAVQTTTVNGINCIKCGKIVQINHSQNQTLTAGQWISIGTLPVGYRPQLMALGCFGWNNSSGHIRIDTSGSVNVFVGTATTETLRFTITFIVP